MFDVDKLQRLLGDCPFGRAVCVLDETESTQNVAGQHIQDGAEDGLVVLAETQRAGRGRYGRAWFSPAGSGIYMSVVFQPRVPYRYLPQVTIVAAAALCRVLRRMTELDVRMKWPNDLFINNRKVCGILMEATTYNGQTKVIMGAGISVNIAQETFPEGLQDKATSLFAASGRTWSREEIVAKFLLELDSLLRLYYEEGFHVFRTIWDAYAWRPSSALEMNTPNGVLRGRPLSIDDNGGLVIKLEDGRITSVYAGEVAEITI